MAVKTPIRTVYTNSVATGLAEYQSGEFIALAHGGLGASLSIGSAGQVLKVNSGASALEFGGVEAVLNIDGMTDGSSATIAATDKLAFSDGGTEKYLVASQIKSYIADVTLTTAAQTNITSVGTLTALTVDDVAINGKVMTMTGSAGDTAVMTVATNGALSLVTTDAAAAAANIQITADGTVDIDSAGVLTLDSGAAINIEPASGSAILLDGTISVDAGVVTGATSITSTAFVGGLTGNASTATLATTVTVTDNESTDENNAIIFAAGGDVDGGSLGLESDGNLTYNPSTGTLNATNLSVTGTQTIVNSVTMNASNAVIFEGATADAYETTLTTVDATADRTLSLPNASDTLVGKATTDTLTNKSIDLGNNTLTGSLAEFNSALQSESFVSLTGTETLTNKTLTSPTINGGTFSGTFTGTMNATSTVFSGASPLVFEGATDDGYETTLAFVDPTADKTVYMPNATGYVPVLSAASTTVITATPAELNYVDGVTSAIQTQLDSGATKAFAIAQAVALG